MTSTHPALSSHNMTALAAEIHADNLRAGWWKKDDQGVTIPRNIGELLCLVHSEICEADEGVIGDLNDDKLPHRKMVEVELADVDIRVLDILGYYGTEIRWDSVEVPAFLIFDAKLGWSDHVRLMHRLVSQSMEHFRKGRTVEGCQRLMVLLGIINCVAVQYGLDLAGAVAEKRAFNAVRADHKPENRDAEGGKKF